MVSMLRKTAQIVKTSIGSRQLVNSKLSFRFFGVALITAPLIANGADWDFQPRIEIGQSWTDNIALAESGLEESEWVTELRPAITVSLDGPRLSGDLDYEMQILKFADNGDSDDIFNRLNGTGQLVVVPETAFIDAFARYDRQNIDTRGRLAFSNVFNSDNRTDYAVAGLSPYHQGTWGAWGESLVRLTGYGVRFRNTDPGVAQPEDSDNVRLIATLNSPSEARGPSWGFRGSYSGTDFEKAASFKYAQALLDLGLPVGGRTRLTATAGKESDALEDPSKGSLDSTVWFVGFEWEPSDLQSLEVRGGDRFYGTAWEASWRRRGSKGELMVDYTEDPTTSSGVLGDDDLFLPGFPTIDIGSLDSRVFLQKRLSGQASYEFTRSTILARIYSDRREYLDSLSGQEDGVGGTLSFTWDAAARTSVATSVTLEKRKFEANRKDDFAEFDIGVTRQINRVLSAELSYRHFLRNSNSEPDYNANLISLFVVFNFGDPDAAPPSW